MEFYSERLWGYLVSHNPSDILVRGRKLRTLLTALERSGLVVERVGNLTNIRNPQALLAWLTLDEGGGGFTVTFSPHISLRKVAFQPELLLPSQFLTRKESGWSFYGVPILNALGVAEVSSSPPEESEAQSLLGFKSLPHGDVPILYHYKSEEWQKT